MLFHIHSHWFHPCSYSHECCPAPAGLQTGHLLLGCCCYCCLISSWRWNSGVQEVEETKWEVGGSFFFLSFLDKQSRFIQSGQVQNDSIISTAAQLTSCIVELLVNWIELASRWLFHRKGRDIQSLQASGCQWHVSACFVFSGFTVIFLEINK